MEWYNILAIVLGALGGVSGITKLKESIGDE